MWSISARKRVSVRAKATHLSDPAKRARNHHGDLTQVHLREILHQKAKLAGHADRWRLWEEANAYLQKATLSSAKFAAMARAAAVSLRAAV